MACIKIHCSLQKAHLEAEKDSWGGQGAAQKVLQGPIKQLPKKKNLILGLQNEKFTY